MNPKGCTVNVGLRKMEVTIPEGVLVARTSRKGREPFCSPSTVKRRAACRLFSRSENSALLALLTKNEKSHKHSDHTWVATRQRGSSTLANFFVDFFDKKISADEWPLMYDHYVEDVFSFFVSKAKSTEFLERINSLPLALCSTVEGEENGSLPFLDFRATTTPSGIVTSIFRKPIFTGLYTPWDSFSPTGYKVDLVRSMAHRIIRICSPTTVEGELTALRDILAKNGYPG